MRKAMHYLFAFVCFAAVMSGIQAYASELKFTRGEKLNHALSVCLDKADAIAIVDAHAKGGFEAASALWEKSANCGTVPVVGPSVGRVVHSVAVRRDGKELIARVVEIVSEQGVLGFFITTAPVNGSPPMKKERDS